MSRTATADAIAIAYEPTPKQLLFHRCPADELLYGGAAGGGKSRALLADAIAHCLGGPNRSALLLRRTFPELKKSHITESYKLLAPLVAAGLARYNKNDRCWTFWNGSTLYFGYCKREEDVYQYQSAEFGWIGFDELTHFTEFQYLYLLGRLRSPRADEPKRIRAATNPGNIGHAWVCGRWRILTSEPYTLWQPEPSPDEPDPLTRCFIPATLDDNPHLLRADPRYLSRLEAQPEPWRSMLRYGRWDAFPGQAFPDWRPQYHICVPFEIPRTWRRFRSLDWGHVAPASVGWYAISPEGQLYRYRELYVAGLLAEDLAARVLTMSEGEDIEYTVGSPDLRQRRGQTGESIGETLQRHGLIVRPANHDRIAGKQRCHAWLKLDRAADGSWQPRFQVFNSCKHFLRTVPVLPTNPNRPEDVDRDAEDHAYEEWRYAVMSRPEPQGLQVRLPGRVRPDMPPPGVQPPASRTLNDALLAARRARERTRGWRTP